MCDSVGGSVCVESVEEDMENAKADAVEAMQLMVTKSNELRFFIVLCYLL